MSLRKRCCLILVTLASLSPHQRGAAAQKVIMVSGIYPARAASFGATIPDYLDRVNLLYPPQENTSLCEYPEALKGVTRDPSLNVNVLPEPIALVLSNDCSAEQQAAVALDIQQNISNQLQFIIIYGGPDDGDFLYTLQRDTDPPPLLDSIGILYVTPETGDYLQQHFDRRKIIWGGNPYFMEGDNFEWTLIAFFEPYMGNNTAKPTTNSDNNGGPVDHFYWFRILLFTLLILSPCCRAGYLWYVGGGRIRFRRNEHGRVVGIEYVPPMPYWLSSGMVPARMLEPTSSRLTEEQFALLPEIVYQPPEDASEKSEHEFDDGDHEDKDVEQTAASSSSVCSPPESAPEPASSAELIDARTSCTMCSICIDDFETGERLTFLPRCSHAFHRDCIHPWLTERQGCCPMCKSNVLEDAAAEPSASSLPVPRSEGAATSPSETASDGANAGDSVTDEEMAIDDRHMGVIEEAEESEQQNPGERPER